MYITQDEFWMLNSIPVLAQMSDTQKENMILQVSNEIDEYTNTSFVPKGDSCITDTCSVIYPRKRPLLSVLNISFYRRPLIEGSDYFVYPEFSKIELNINESGKRALLINYAYGYEQVPSTVKQVIVELLKFNGELMQMPAGGIASENWFNEYSVTYSRSKDASPADYRKSIFERLDIFKQPVYGERRPSSGVAVRAGVY